MVAAGFFHAGDTPWVQTSRCWRVQRCQDGGEDRAGALSLPLCSADKPGEPFPLTFLELCSNQEQTLTCCSPLAGPEKPQPTQTAARSEQALVMLLFPAQCKALQGLICAHAAPRQAAAASSPLLSAASLHGPTPLPSPPEPGMVHFLRGSRRCREMPAPNRPISSQSTHGSW